MVGDSSKREPLRTEVEQIVERLASLVDGIDAVAIANGDFISKRQQLLTVSRSIRDLEGKKIPVPDELRLLKTKLHTELAEVDAAQDAINYLENHLDRILKHLKRLNISSHKARGRKGRRAQGSRQPVTPQEAYEPLIIEALKEFGGRAYARDVRTWIEKKMKKRFLPGDLATRLSDGRTIVWWNNAQWQRQKMVYKGILKNDSPRGVWELVR
jgi:hypothetical protein